MRSIAIFLTLAMLAACQTAGPIASQSGEVKTRPGGTVRYDIFTAEHPVATILMFEGAGGLFRPGGPGFVDSQYGAFVKRGYTVAVMHPPADQRSFRDGGMDPYFRDSSEHLRDIDAVLDRLHTRSAGPIWLLGISIGTRSVGAYASAHPEAIDGAVFLSSSTRSPGGGRSVADQDYGGLKAPVLAIAHRDDSCPGTPPQGARQIAAAASNSVDAKSMMITGGGGSGRNPCGVHTHHVYAGVESKVVAAVDDFIRAHLN